MTDLLARNYRMREDLNWVVLAAAVAVLALASILRLQANDFGRQLLPGDESTYRHAALAINQCHTLIKDVTGTQLSKKCIPSAGLAPGYPLVLAAVYSITGPSDTAAQYLNLAFSLMTVLGSGMLVMYCTRSRWASFATMLLAAAYPGLIYNVDRLLTEQLFCFLFIWGLCFAARTVHKSTPFNAFLTGLLFFYAVQVRSQAAPVALIVPLFFAASLGAGPRIYKILGTYFAAGVLVFLPWIVRNYLNFHSFIPLVTSGEGPRIWGAVPYFLDMGATEPGVPLRTIVEMNSQPNPALYIRWRVFGYTNFLFGDVWDERAAHLPWWTQRLLPTHAIGLLGLLFAPWICWHARSLSVWLCAMSAATLFWTGMPFHGLPRYALPIILLALCLAGIGGWALVCRIAGLRKPEE